MKKSAVVMAFLLVGCGDSADQRFSVASGVTACETEEWARERATILEDDPTAADRFAADRCFVVETSVDLVVAEQPFAAGLRGEDRFIRIEAVGGGAGGHGGVQRRIRRGLYLQISQRGSRCPGLHLRPPRYH